MRNLAAPVEMKRTGAKFFNEAAFNEGGMMHKSSALYQEERYFRSQSPDTQYDVFLVHTLRDKTLVANFKKFLVSRGASVYIDWLNDDEHNREDYAGQARRAMSNSKSLLYLHTHSGITSKWPAWEVGYFEAMKGASAIAVLPFLNHSRILPPYGGGQEYLRLYTQIGVEYLDQFIRTGLFS
jgi:hypothetical protein